MPCSIPRLGNDSSRTGNKLIGVRHMIQNAGNRVRQNANRDRQRCNDLLPQGHHREFCLRTSSAMTRRIRRTPLLHENSNGENLQPDCLQLKSCPTGMDQQPARREIFQNDMLIRQLTDDLQELSGGNGGHTRRFHRAPISVRRLISRSVADTSMELWSVALIRVWDRMGMLVLLSVMFSIFCSIPLSKLVSIWIFMVGVPGCEKQ